MKSLARRSRAALSKARLKVYGALLSLLGPAALNSCGLYMPPPVLYAPPPHDEITVKGVVRDSISRAPIPAVSLKLVDESDQGAEIYSAYSGNDGKYVAIISLYDGRMDGHQVSLEAKDADGTLNGSYASQTVSLGPVAFEGPGARREIDQDVDLDEAAK
jgi:hypothetical protein